MYLVWGYGEYNKSYEHESQKCHLKVFSTFFPLDWSNGLSDESLPISTLFHSRIVSCSASAFYALSHGVSKCSHAFCHAQGWQANDISQATLTLARPNGAKSNGAKMTSRSLQKIPERMSEAKRVKIALPRFSFLTTSNLTPKEDFEQLFNFQGPIISECTIVVLEYHGPMLLR